MPASRVVAFVVILPSPLAQSDNEMSSVLALRPIGRCQR
jgi:hypothetical protein